MFLILVSVFILAFCFIGLGLLIQCGIFKNRDFVGLHTFWIGWSLLIVLLQLWHLFFRINEFILVFFVGAGLIGIFLYGSVFYKSLKEKYPIGSVQIIVILLLALWLSNKATGPITNFDTGLYHLGAVKWAKAFPVVFGLGNLHELLALNSSFFLYASMLDSGLWVDRSHHLANTVLLFMLCIQLLLSLFQLFRERVNPQILDVFHAFIFPAALVYSSGAMASLSPDPSVFVLQLILSGHLLSFLTASEKEERSHHLFMIMLLASVGITMKLSFLVFGLSTMIIAILKFFLAAKVNDGGGLKQLLRIVAIPALVLIPYIIQGIISSGYWFFPSTFGEIDASWRVPRSMAVDTANWVYSAARIPGVHWSEVIGNWNWFPLWLERVSQQLNKQLVIGAFGFLLIALVGYRNPVVINWRDSRWLFFLPALASLAFWFFTAPEPRFAGSALWIVAAGLAAFAVHYAMKSVPTETSNPLWYYAVLVGIFIFVFPLHGPLIVAPGNASYGLHPIPHTEFKNRVTKSGLIIHFPDNPRAQCWSVPIPCTQRFRPNLTPIQKGELGKGFFLDRSNRYADMKDWIYPGVHISKNLGIELRNGWHSYESEDKIRWMQTPATVLVYTDYPRIVNFSVVPFAIKMGNGFGSEGRLRIQLNQDRTFELTVKADQLSTLQLPLQGDFNSLKLDFLGGNIVPAKVIPGSTDERSVSIAFRMLSITSVN